MSEPKPDLPPTAKPAAKPKAAKKVVSTESRLAKLGLRTDMDLVLHLPMRYEDETKVYTIRDACLRGGESWQVEGVVTKCEVNFKPRKQLLVTIADETGNLLLRFMNFYGSQVKQLAEGTRVRARAAAHGPDARVPVRRRLVAARAAARDRGRHAPHRLAGHLA